jgi:pyruvate dehydrogenase E2 component (dihydrolipoamide acetyltransferase)
MPIQILMPALSPTMTEGNLVKWLKKEGEAVVSGDVLAEIETDKATMEVESIDEGILAKIVVPDATEGVKVNELIAIILEEGEDAAALSETASTPQAAAAPPPTAQAESVPAPDAAKPVSTPSGERVFASPLARRMALQAGLDLTALKGSGPNGRIVKSDIQAALSGGAATSPPIAQAESVPASDAAKPVSTPSGERVSASPLAQRMAQQSGLDLANIKGSGPEGRIVKNDIEAALSSSDVAATAPAATPVAAPAGVAAYTEVPNSMMRKIIAQRLGQAKRDIPHFYLSVDCDVDALLALREDLNAKAPEGEGAYKLSLNDFVVRAVALTLRKVPAANATWTDEAIQLYSSIDISVAVATPGGLITPIIRDADNKGLARISAETRDLAGRAREGKLLPEEYQGGGFTISNMGMYGVKEFAAIINPPQSCILAVGAAEQRPVVKDGALAIATVMTCTLSVDHRSVDGALGAEFMAAFKALIEEPLTMLL